jgi:hypothetical protein
LGELARNPDGSQRKSVGEGEHEKVVEAVLPRDIDPIDLRPVRQDGLSACRGSRGNEAGEISRAWHGEYHDKQESGGRGTWDYEISLLVDRGAARVVVLRVSGTLGDRELAALADQLEKGPDVETDFSLLIDLREADGRKVTSAGVRALAKRRLVLSPESRRAVVVPSELGFGMARMYELLCGDRGGSTRTFRDCDEARRWVETGVP